NENEHNFGTVQGDLTTKPAYEAIKTLTHELDGMRLERRIATTNQADYVLSFMSGKGQHVIAAWTTGQPQMSKVTLTGKGTGKISGKAGLGEAFEVRMSGNGFELELSELPKYLQLGSVRVVSVQ